MRKEATKKEIIDMIKRREREYKKDVIYWEKMANIHKEDYQISKACENHRKRSLSRWCAINNLMSDLDIKKEGE